MEKKYFLSIDRGQTGIKAAFCDMDAEVVAVASCPCDPLESPKAGWAQQDMNRIWEQTKTAIARLFSKCDIKPEEIAAISFSGQGGGNFIVSEDGKPVYPGKVSMDARHEEVMSHFENPEGIPVTNEIGFMLWLKENEPEAYKKSRWILGSKDWIRYCLTGKANTDMSDTPAPVDFKTKEYDKRGCDVIGCPEVKEMLAPLVYASEVVGAVTKDAAMQTGLIEGTPVVAGAHDMIACSVGAGGIKQGHLAIIMGTMGINICVVDKDTEMPEPEIPGKSFTFGGVCEGMRTATSSISSGCNTMNWFLDLLFKEEEKEAEERGIPVFALLEEKLLGRKPSKVLFQPYLLGTFYNSSAKAGLIGIDATTTREDILLSLFQGICLSMCMEIESLENRVQKFDDIWIVGGGSKSKIWGQMFADVLNRPVHIPSTSEVGCRGAAICAGIALGVFDPENLPQMSMAKTYEPNADKHAEYMKQMPIYKQAYEANADIWDQQKKL